LMVIYFMHRVKRKCASSHVLPHYARSTVRL